MSNNGYTVCKSHYFFVFIHQGLLDMMIQEEESLKKRLISSIQACRAEMETLYLELQLPIFQVKEIKKNSSFPLRAQSDFLQTSVAINVEVQSCKFELLFQEEKGISMLQQEKNLRTQVEALMKEKANRMQRLKTLLEQDQDLCDILCSMPYGIAADCVPSVEQLENFHQHIQNQNEEKVERKIIIIIIIFFFFFL